MTKILCHSNREGW